MLEDVSSTRISPQIGLNTTSNTVTNPKKKLTLEEIDKIIGEASKQMAEVEWRRTHPRTELDDLIARQERQREEKEKLD